MIDPSVTFMERKIDEIVRFLEAKKELDRYNTKLGQQRLEKVWESIITLISQKRLELTEMYLQGVMQRFFKPSETEAKIVFAVILFRVYLERDRPQTTLVRELVGRFLETAKRVRQIAYAAFVAELYGKILQDFSNGLMQILEHDANFLIADLTLKYARLQSDERYIVYSLLWQIILRKHYLLLKDVKNIDLASVFHNVISEKDADQKIALQFAKKLLEEISGLERDEQKSCMTDTIQELLREGEEKQTTNNEYFFVAWYQILKYFFKRFNEQFYSQEECAEIFARIRNMSQVQQRRRSPEVCRTFFQLLPRMVKFNRKVFYDRRNFPMLISLLMKLAEDLHDSRILEPLFKCCRKLIKMNEGNDLKSECDKIREQIMKILEGWPERMESNFEYAEIFLCLDLVIRSMQMIPLGSETRINTLVDKILIYGFKEVTLPILQFLHSSQNKYFNSLIETKLRYTIAIILKKNIKAFEDEQRDLDDQSTSIMNKKASEMILREPDGLNESEVSDVIGFFEDERKSSMMIFEDQNELNTTIHALLNGRKSEKLPSRERLAFEVSEHFRVHRKEYLDEFAAKLEGFYKDDRKQGFVAVDENRISIALEALAKFDFGAKTNAKRSIFIKDTVLAYLEDKSAKLRKRAARIVFHLSSDQNPPFKANLSLSNKIIQGIINKMMSIAIGDPDNEVREETLTALNEPSSHQFIPYLVSEDNLKKLIILVYDMNYKIQKQSILLLEKLIPTYPELLNRFDQIIFRTISFLGTQNKTFGEEDKNHVKILQIIGKHSQFLIDGRLPVIVSLLVDILSNCMVKSVFDANDKSGIITAIFKCLAQLFDFQPMLSRQYFQKCLDIFFINIKKLDDKTLTYLFRCIIVLTRNSNYQLILVIKYNIYQCIFEILDRNAATDLRSAVLKLIGTIGAIDPSMIKKILRMRNKGKLSPHMTIAEIEVVLQKLRRKSFNFERHLHEDKNPKEEALIKNFENFKNNVKLIQKNSKEHSAAGLVTQRSKILKNVILDLKQKFVARKIATQEPLAVEASLTYKIQNQDSLLKFVTSQTLVVLFNGIESSTDKEQELIRFSLESIQQIILNLARNVAEFKDILFNRLISYFYKNAVPEFKKMTLQNIKYFIKAYGIEISKENEYISILIKLLIRFFPNDDYHSELFAICRLLIDYKMSLRHRFKDIVTTLLSMLLTDPTKPASKDIFELLLHLDNQEYLYLITPAFIKLTQHFKKGLQYNRQLQNNIMQMIFAYFKKIKTTKHFEHFSGNIIRAAIAVKQENAELTDLVQNFFIDIIKSLRERCYHYLTLLHDHLINHPEYKRILLDLEQKGYIEEEPPTNNPVSEEANNFQTMNESETNLQALSIRESKYEPIKNAFVITNSSKSHNWEEWFNRLASELINNSPSTVLIACKGLVFHLETVKQLFKPAFVIFWSQLKDQQRAQILRGFDTIISNPSRIPLKVRKEIIDLIEFMSHENRYGLVLDITKLSEFSLQCHSVYKAIFFKELEFPNNPENTIGTLLKLYSEAGYKYAAEGLLEYAQNTLKLSVNLAWHCSLGRWDQIYANNKVETSVDLDLQLQCNLELSNWDWVLDKIKEVIKKADDVEHHVTLKKYGARAAFHLGRWTDLARYNDNSNEDKEFYGALMQLVGADYRKAKKTINEAVKILEKDSSSLANYSTAYEKIVKLQNIVELEEIVGYQQRFKALAENELYHYVVPRETQEREQMEARAHILRVWEDRLNSSESNIQHWQRILSSRQIFCSKADLLNSYLKFGKMCFSNDNSLLYTRTISALKNESVTSNLNNELVTLAQIECEYKTGKIQQTQVIGLIEDLSSKKSLSKNYKQMLYKKLGTWLLKSEILVDQKHEKVIKFLEKALCENKVDYRLWHYYAVANYDMLRELEKVDAKEDVRIKYLLNALEGFTRSISLEIRPNGKYTIQDLLRFLELWYGYHDLENAELKEKIEKAVEQIQNKDWILISGQIIARLEQNESFSNAVRNIVISLSKEYPQTLIFPLLVAQRSKTVNRSRMATKIIRNLNDTHRQLVQDATVFSDELIRVSVLFEEQWYHGFGEAYRHRQENNMESVKTVLSSLFYSTSRKNVKLTHNEISFIHQYGTMIKRAEDLMTQFHEKGNEICFLLAWDTLYSLYKQLEASFKSKTGCLYLENVSPALLAFKNSSLIVPGTMKLFSYKSPEIRIASINPILKLLNSKRKPRKLSLYGSNNKEYSFLLKGNEDLRQDERVMQLLNLVNDLLTTNASLDNHSLKIVTFNVLPLSNNCGIISWLEGCDTMHELIRDYREKIKVNVACERKLVSQFCENYDILSKMKKLEIFKFVCDNTKAEDLKKIFWLRSPSAEVWLSHRNNFICSSAVMSMVGYILGLGDRHLMNIMLEKSTGRIVHIDFGDCFENASLREKLPERVPFRLTRVMTNAMEACGTEGTFRSICEKVMNIMRSNKEVILALLEEFICDPIITGNFGNKNLNEEVPDEDKHLLPPVPNKPKDLKLSDHQLNQQDPLVSEEAQKREGEPTPRAKKAMSTVLLKPPRIANSKATEALQRIRNKLVGKDFDNVESDYKTQVRKLIKQATSVENISQSFSGWNPFL